MFYIVGYRKKVVFDNISKSFPEKSKQEVEKTAKLFFRHLCDLIVESIKNFNISKEELSKRVTFKGTEVLLPYANAGQNVIGTAGHCGGWEVISVHMGSIEGHYHHGIVKPLVNKFFNDMIFSTRTKFGTGIIPVKQVKDYFEKEHHNPIGISFIADQWPNNPLRCHWTEFLGRETPFFYGAEKYARETNWPVFYIDVIKTKRGYYTAEFSMICKDPSKTEKGEIIEAYVKKLEATILRQPEFYLWSHRRWKKTKAEVLATKKS